MIASMYGTLEQTSLTEDLVDIKNLTEEKIDEIVQWFSRDFKAAKL